MGAKLFILSFYDLDFRRFLCLTGCLFLFLAHGIAETHGRTWVHTFTFYLRFCGTSFMFDSITHLLTMMALGVHQLEPRDFESVAQSHTSSDMRHTICDI